MSSTAKATNTNVMMYEANFRTQSPNLFDLLAVDTAGVEEGRFVCGEFVCGGFAVAAETGSLGSVIGGP